MVMKKASGRVGKEYGDLHKNPIDGAVVEAPNPDDLNIWHVHIAGPKGTPYAGGRFTLSIDFTNNYPFKAPEIYHPNVKTDTGEVCDDLIRNEWTPTLNARFIITTIQKMIEHPNIEHPLEEEIAYLCKEKPKDFAKNAAAFTKKHAT